MKILIDRNIERNAVIRQTASATKSILWGENTYEVDVLEAVDKSPRNDEVFRLEQIPYLASLCSYAKTEKINFYTSFELRMEAFRQKGSDDGYLGLNLLDGIKITEVRCPVVRSITIGSAGRSIGSTESEQMDFFKKIKDQRFQFLLTQIPPKHIDDAFHLWTAEINNLDCFLTMDRKFQENVTKKQKILRSVRVMTPQLLCQELGLDAENLEKIREEQHPFL